MQTETCYKIQIIIYLIPTRIFIITKNKHFPIRMSNCLHIWLYKISAGTFCKNCLTYMKIITCISI